MVCRNCGETVQEGMKFCPMCGAVIADTQNETAKSSATPQVRVEKKSRVNSRVFVLGVALVICLAAGWFGVQEQEKSRAYDAAVNLYNKGEYTDAQTRFSELGNYKDAAEYSTDAAYMGAIEVLKSGNYDEAKELFQTLSPYKESDGFVTECDYQKGIALFNKGKYNEARALFESIAPYKTTEEYIRKSRFSKKYEYYEDKSDENSAFAIYAQTAKEADEILSSDFCRTWYNATTGEPMVIDLYTIDGQEFSVLSAATGDYANTVEFFLGDNHDTPLVMSITQEIFSNLLGTYDDSVYLNLGINYPTHTEYYYDITLARHNELQELDEEMDHEQASTYYWNQAPANQQLSESAAKQKAYDMVYNLVSNWKKENGFASTQIDYTGISVTDQGSTYIAKTKVYYWYSHGGYFDGYSYAVFIIDKYTGNVISSYVE